MNLVSSVTDELTLDRHLDRQAQNDPLRRAVAAAVNAFAFASIDSVPCGRHTCDASGLVGYFPQGRSMS